jgi:Inorganic pyrophosphatase
MIGYLDGGKWGFIPSTKAEDGDPLDVLIVHDAATYPGLVLKCKPIGVLEVVQSSKDGNERNDRVFVVPDRSPFEATCRTFGACWHGNRGAGEVLRGDQWAGIEEAEVSGLARPRQGHQDHKEGCGLGAGEDLNWPPDVRRSVMHSPASAFPLIRN